MVVIFGGIFFWKYASYETTLLTVESSILEVKPWATFSSILIDNGADSFFTKVYLRDNLPDFQLQVWSYSIPENANVKTLLEALKNPINQTDINLTFLEWWNIFDIDQYLTNQQLIDAGDFIEYSENYCNASIFPGSMKDWSCDLHTNFAWLEWTDSLEWYLYPDTYAINPNTFTVKTLARKMLSNFDSKVYTPLFTGLDNKAIFENIVLASIVEKEERNSDEKSTVAGILKKRLDEWWMIGADITVCYPFRLTAEECKLSVTKYLYEVNDYNTRQKVGLPAGPIWNPSFETVSATLKSKDSEYYYYLHDTETGQIYYGRTNAEHDWNKQLYLR